MHGARFRGEPGQKPDRITASGVSSIIKSIPVAVSRARILRPSRPIMRPFISSFGKATVETVVSATWSAAQRCIAIPTISRALVSASFLASFSISQYHNGCFIACFAFNIFHQNIVRFSACVAGYPLKLSKLLLIGCLGFFIVFFSF